MLPEVHATTAIITHDSASGAIIYVDNFSHLLHFQLPLSSAAPHVHKDLDTKSWNSASFSEVPRKMRVALRTP